MVYSFLLIGQSNAAGRGKLDEAEPLDTCGKKLKVFRNGRWHTMYRPVNADRVFSGTCLAESFAKAYSEAHPDAEVGIIPCADGGTCLEQWAPGGLLFDYAVSCARLAMRTSRLSGVLWHQGEGDCTEERFPLYYERFREILRALRQELGMEELPVLVGGLGDFLADCSLAEYLKNYPRVNEALRRVAEDENRCAFVPAEGLGANPDNLHFHAAALKEFGERYYEAYRSLGGETAPMETADPENGHATSAMEQL